jgi:hypothetical protein
MDIQELVKNEIEFCNEIDCEKNEHEQFIYESKNRKSSMNLPYVLQEYKQWLIDKGLVNESAVTIKSDNSKVIATLQAELEKAKELLHGVKNCRGLMYSSPTLEKKITTFLEAK